MPTIASPATRSTSLVVGKPSDGFICNVSDGQQPDARYDLVTTHYAHPAMPQLEFYDRIASWVAPGGTLFIVGHLHRGSHGDGSAHGHGHGDHLPPASASATAGAITARLDPASWDVSTAHESQRTAVGPDGKESTIHDVVVKAALRQ